MILSTRISFESHCFQRAFACDRMKKWQKVERKFKMGIHLKKKYFLADNKEPIASVWHVTDTLIDRLIDRANSFVFTLLSLWLFIIIEFILSLARGTCSSGYFAFTKKWYFGLLIQGNSHLSSRIYVCTFCALWCLGDESILFFCSINGRDLEQSRRTETITSIYFVWCEQCSLFS